MYKLILTGVIILFTFGCKKDTITKPIAEEPQVVVVPLQDSLKFLFVNKVGYKNDSIVFSPGNTRYMAGVCLKTGYYNVKTNISNIINTCYSKNYPGNPLYILKDSMMQGSYPSYIGSYYNLQVELVWKNQATQTIKVLIYAQKQTPINDTVKTTGNKLIKFVWPDDTLPNSNFKKTYQYP